LKYDFVSGQMNYIYHDINNKYKGKELYYKKCLEKDAIYYTVGGLFIIKRKHWELVGGMNNKYKKSEDYDLALRLAKNNIYLLRKKEIIGNTYMISYRDTKRMYAEIINKNVFYPTSLIYREHFFNKYMWTIIIRNDSSMIILLIAFLISVIFNNYFLLLMYPIFLIIRISKRDKKLKNLLIRFPFLIIKDILVIIGFFFFFPQKNKTNNIKYTKIK